MTNTLFVILTINITNNINKLIYNSISSLWNIRTMTKNFCIIRTLFLTNFIMSYNYKTIAGLNNLTKCIFKFLGAGRISLTPRYIGDFLNSILLTYIRLSGSPRNSNCINRNCVKFLFCFRLFKLL